MDAYEKEAVMAETKRLGASGKMGIAVTLVVLAVTTFISLVDAGMDPSKINWLDWATRLAINVTLALVTMFAGEVTFMSWVTLKPEGKYQEALTDYKEARARIETKTNYFGQYLKMRHDNAVRKADLNYLIDHRIEQPRAILQLDLSEVKFLNKPYEKKVGDTVYRFKTQTKAQRKIIKFVLKGGVMVKRVPKGFYLDSNSDFVGMDDYMQAAYLVSMKQIIKHSGRIMKVASMVIVSAIMAGITVNDFKGDNVQAWANLIMRISTCVGGFFSGCMTSNRVNGVECQELTNKKIILSEFGRFMENNPNRFPKTDEEAEADEQYKEVEANELNHQTDEFGQVAADGENAKGIA